MTINDIEDRIRQYSDLEFYEKYVKLNQLLFKLKAYRIIYNYRIMSLDPIEIQIVNTFADLPLTLKISNNQEIIDENL